MRGGALCLLALAVLVSAGVACSVGDERTERCIEQIAARASQHGGSSLHTVAAEVERMRALRFRRLPQPRYLSAATLRKRVRAEIDASYPAAEAQADTRILIALGALPRNTNVKGLLRRALPSQVAGYYDPQTGELVVLSDAKRRLNGVERVTLAHELVHAVTDQRLRFPAYLEAQQPPEGREDAVAAGLALVEGDATLITEAYAAAHLSARDVLDALGPALASEEELEKLPYHVRASSLFPYEEGTVFACRVYGRGGWRAVDRAYRTPPATTAQVLFPARYFTRERAVDPPDPAPPGPGWERVDRTALGAADLMWLFQAPGGKTARALSTPRRRAAAWAGGEAHLWRRGHATRVTLTLVQRRGHHGLCASVDRWIRAATLRGAILRCSGRLVRATLRG